MNPSNPSSQYILLFHGPDWDRGLTREQTQQTLDRVMVWFGGLQERGIIRGGNVLDGTGTTISRERGEVVVDGPYAESKEILAGYLMLEVEDLEAALAIARQCPTLELGVEIEVRPVLAECPIGKRLREQPALVTA
jgi:hypothetical protein